MTTTNPTLLAMPIAKNGSKNTIPATQAALGNGLMSQSTGFPPETALPLSAGGIAPSREDFNGALNLLSGIAYYSQKGWTFEYDATQDYYKGCVVIDPSDGKRYECVADMTIAHTIAPHSDTAHTYWKEFIVAPDLSAYAPLASPAFTGTPTAPTAAASTNNTQIATTAFVKTAVSGIDLSSYAKIASPAFTGTPTAPTAATSTNSTQIATTAYVKSNLSSYAPKDSPALTGTPTAPTAAAGTNTTQLATTAFVQAAITANGGGISASSLGANGYIRFANGFTMEWGTYTAVQDTTEVQITLPIALTTAIYAVYIGLKDSTFVNGMSPMAIATKDETTTSFKFIYAYDQYANEYRWLVLGK